MAGLCPKTYFCCLAYDPDHRGRFFPPAARNGPRSGCEISERSVPLVLLSTPLEERRTTTTTGDRSWTDGDRLLDRWRPVVVL